MHRPIKLPGKWRKPGICGVVLLAGIAAATPFVFRQNGGIETRREPVAAAVAVAPLPETSQSQPPSADTLELGRILFLREWRPNDPRSHGGDGLGPVFNESSCVACHHQGGVGGGGPADKNVDIITAAPISAPGPATRGGLRRNSARAAGFRDDLSEVASIHPAFRTSPSAVLYRFGTEPTFADWWCGIAGSNLQPVA